MADAPGPNPSPAPSAAYPSKAPVPPRDAKAALLAIIRRGKRRDRVFSVTGAC